MARKTNFSFVLLLVLLVSFDTARAGRRTPNDFKNAEVKQPSSLISDRSLLIPGIGRVLLPPSFSSHPITKVPPYDPYAGARGYSYAPGRVDTSTTKPGKAGTTAAHP